MNPIFNRFQQNQMPSGGILGNMSNLLGRFNEFKQNFRGDPRAQVEQLLQSGQMTQEQFQQLSNMANQFQSMIGKNN